MFYEVIAMHKDYSENDPRLPHSIVEADGIADAAARGAHILNAHGLDNSLRGGHYSKVLRPIFGNPDSYNLPVYRKDSWVVADYVAQTV